MRITLLTCLLVTLSLSAQKKTDNSKSGEKTLNELIANIQQNPNNPLNVDSQSLMDVANKLPDGSLKNKLISYSQNIGVDKDLSMRQVYYDIGVAFNKNNQIVSETQFQNMGAGLNLLLQNPEKVADKLKTVVSSYGNGMFLNDPSYRAQLSSTLGVPMMNQDVAMGATLVVAALADIQQNKQYKLDYKKYYDMAAVMVYSEADRNLGKSLIDAGVLKATSDNVTPLYKYDFENGSSLDVRNGILTLTNMFTGLSKKLVEVESKNEGVPESGDMHPIKVEVSPDEAYFVLTTGKKPDPESGLKKKEGYLINSLTGEAVTQKHLYNVISYTNIHQATITREKLHYYGYNPQGNKLFSVDFLMDAKYVYKNVDMPNGDNFLIKNKMKKAALLQFTSFGVESNDELLSLVWAYGLDSSITLGPQDLTMYSSTYLYGDKVDNKKGTNKGLSNKLTGIAATKNGDFFYTTANGQLGKVAGPTQNYSNIDNLLSKAKVTNLARPYDFTVKNNYIFDGRGGGFGIAPLPIFVLSKDEKWLVYTVDSKMYLIETADTSNTKEFDLTAIPYNLFFTKENSDYVLNLMSFNEFKMPIIKKYSFSKLCTSKKLPPVTANTASNSQASGTSSSISDEITKLKALLDDGTLTKEEFAKAKKKLLKDD